MRIPRLLILLFPLLLASCSGGGSRVDGLQGLGDLRYHRVESRETGHGYHVHVRLPADYETQSDEYPVVYLLDGGAMFPKLSGFYHYLHIGEELPGLILVGISYGTDRFAEGNFRASDYTAPSAERDYWGDAPKFQRFLSRELLPLLERRYRMRPDRRVLFGQSLGGQFVLYSALSEPELFWGRIASNPAIHANTDYFVRHSMPLRRRETYLFVGLAEHDAPVFGEAAQPWVTAMRSRADRPWCFEARTLPSESHFSAAPAAFRQGLTWMLAANGGCPTPGEIAPGAPVKN